MSRHPIALGVFLGVVVIGIGSFARWGLKRGERGALRDELEPVLRLASQGDFATIEEKLDALLERYPNEPTVWLNLGIAQAAQNRLEEAERTFSKVLELDPTDYDSIAELAVIAQLRGNTAQAFDYLERIPPHEGRMEERLRRDPTWIQLRSNPRMQALHVKHGLQSLGQGSPGPAAPPPIPPR